WIRDLDSLQPDLVVDTGDNWAHHEALAPLLHALEPLLARPGAYVMGSNDYFGPIAKNPAKYLFPRSRPHGKTPPERHLPADLLAKELTAAGWIDLNNRRDTLTLRGTRLDLAGTDDAHIGRDAYPEAGPTSDARQRGPSPAERSRATAPSSDERARGEGPPSEEPTLRVGVTHAPYSRVLSAMRADGVELALAGHTHGGQLAVPGWGALVTNCDLDTRRAKGLHGWPGDRPDSLGGSDSMWLHVSAGLGTSPYTPVRLACRPEADR